MDDDGHVDGYEDDGDEDDDADDDDVDDDDDEHDDDEDGKDDEDDDDGKDDDGVAFATVYFFMARTMLRMYFAYSVTSMVDSAPAKGDAATPM